MAVARRKGARGSVQNGSQLSVMADRAFGGARTAARNGDSSAHQGVVLIVVNQRRNGQIWKEQCESSGVRPYRHSDGCIGQEWTVDRCSEGKREKSLIGVSYHKRITHSNCKLQVRLGISIEEVDSARRMT